MATQIKLRRDTAANWNANSTVVLAAGEIGVDLTNGAFKLGNGISIWSDLDYFEPGASAGSNVTTGTTAPSSPELGNLWYDTVSGRMYVYYDNTWVDANPVGSASSTATNELVNGSKTVSLGTEGKLTLPAGTTYEYLAAPLTGHGDGLARLDFALVTDGVNANWIAASASPAGSGYSAGDTFTFNAAFLGIPGASVTIEVLTVGAGGSVEDLAFSMPPLYPADIYRDSPINLQVGPESNRWTFGATGNLTLPNGGVLRTDGNNVEVGGVTNFNVEASGVVNVYTNDGAHQWQFGDDSTLSLPTQSTPILTVNNVAPTPKIYRATSSNDASAINAAQASWYDAELTYIDIRDQDEIEKEYIYPWSGLPSWEAQELLADWNVNHPDGAPNPNSALSPALTNAVNAYLNWKELESNIDIVSGDKTFRFGNNGNLSLPGEITFTDTANAKIVVGANPSPYEGTPTPVSTWTFGVGDGNGSITFPNGSVQTTAYTSTPFDKLVNGSKEVVLGSDGVLTMPQQGKLSVAGITAVNLASLETAYNDAEALYSIERTTWMTVNNHTPTWYLLTGLVAYNEILDAAYTEPDWTGTAALESRALAAYTAYNAWQTAITNSELTVKSDASAWTFNSENKLTLPQGGVISGGDPLAITAANNARASEQSDWYYVITTGGADENIRPWHFAGPSQAERSAVVTAMWQAQQTLESGETLGWVPISAAFYNEVRGWIALNSSSDDYTEWKKLTTSVNITSEDKTWTFTNDGNLTFPDGDVQTTAYAGGQGHMMMIDTNRTDTYTEVGSADKPFKTFAAAIAAATASTDTTFTFVLMGCTVTENVNFNGCGLTAITIATSCRSVISGNITIANNPELSQLVVRNIEVGGTFTLTGNATSEQMNSCSFYNVSFSGAVNITATNATAFYEASFFSTVAFTNVSYLYVNGAQFNDDLTITADDTGTYPIPSRGINPGTGGSISIVFGAIANDINFVKGGTAAYVFQPHMTRMGRSGQTYTLPAGWTMTPHSSVLRGTWVNNGTTTMRNSSSDLAITGAARAYTGIIGGDRVVADLVPANSTGAAGDAAGSIAVGGGYLYVCTANWTSPGTANIWTRTLLTTGAW